jgi:phosphate transport system protein
MREELNRQLRLIQDDLLRMSSRVEQAVALAVQALMTWDRTLAQQIIARDSDVDEAYSDLEDAIFNLLATQQPIVGRDLRVLHSAILIANELERMGDYAKGIARSVLVCLRAPSLLSPPPELLNMATLAQQMLKTAIESLIRTDPNLARALAGFDERVDAIDDQVNEALLALARSDPRSIEAVMALRDIAHRVERLADRATNIAERVIFIATSQTELLNTS